MIENNLYPWLQSYWQQFQSLKQQSRVPHALMLSGLEGLGIEQLAKFIGSSMLCQQPDEQGFACGDCKHCKLLVANSHPDYHLIQILEDKKLISVDQIRSLVAVCTEKPHQGGYRIAIISPCAAMNRSAANALLKTLEEPGEDTLIILVANTSNSLPATVRSRCQLVSISPPSEEHGLNWLLDNYNEDEENTRLALKLANFAPLQAASVMANQLALRQKFLAGMESAALGLLDPTKLVASIHKNDFSKTIDWMFSLAMDAAKFQHQVSESSLINCDHLKLIAKLASCPVLKLNRWMDRVLDARKMLSTTSNINPQLLVEDLMFRWIAIFK